MAIWVGDLNLDPDWEPSPKLLHEAEKKGVDEQRLRRAHAYCIDNGIEPIDIKILVHAKTRSYER